MRRIGFLINPIAGMGGRVGLKGTDDVADEARRLGAVPVANARAVEMLAALKAGIDAHEEAPAIQWLTCGGPMGADALHQAGFTRFDIVHEPLDPSSSGDTRAGVQAMVEKGIELLLFCGGDGTARDICRIVGETVPVLGIPAGVKMFSGVFGATPRQTADLLIGFLQGRLRTAEIDVIDLDEERYRQGEWAVRLYYKARTPFEASLLPAAKALIDEAADSTIKDDIAEDLSERMEAAAGTLFILGPGSTIQAIAERIGVEKTLLGIDAVRGGKRIAANLDEAGLKALIAHNEAVTLVLSPIGAQGFVLGRGNLEISPAIVERIGVSNLVIVATPAKLARTPVLRFDTGDPALDARLSEPGYLPVVTGYHRRRMVKAGAGRQ